MGARGKPSRDPNPPGGTGRSAQSRHLTSRRRAAPCSPALAGLPRPAASAYRLASERAAPQAASPARGKAMATAAARPGQARPLRPALGTRQPPTCSSRRSCARPSPRACPPSPPQLRRDHSGVQTGWSRLKRFLPTACSKGAVWLRLPLPPSARSILPHRVGAGRRGSGRASSAPRRGGRGASPLSAVASAGGGAGGRAAPSHPSPPEPELS